jgi:hypothetical protein
LQKHGHLTGISTSSIAQDSLDFIGLGGEDFKGNDDSIKRRSRSYSMRSEKNGEPSGPTSPEILELEK